MPKYLVFPYLFCSLSECFDVMYQTLARVFDHVSKHQEQKLKNEAQLSFLMKV